MLRTNVLVIGGGPAGSIAARFLAAHNISTILIERDLSYIKPCGGGIPDAALHELKIPLNAVAKEIHKIAVVSPHGEMVKVDLKGGHLCLVQRGIFDRTLRELAIFRGAQLSEAEFLRFEETGRNIISVIRKRATNEEIKIKSDYVIASDGITSRAASCLGIRKNRSVYTISAQIPHCPHYSGFNSQPSDDACEFWFSSEHAINFYSWVFPYGDYISVGTGSSDPKKLTHLLKKFIRRRSETSENHKEGLRSIKLRAFKIPLWSVTIFNTKNILFAGDAAGTVMPATYEGIYYAMKSGEYAARAIAEGNPALYKKLWNSRFRNRFLLMSKIRDYLFRSDAHIEKFVSIHKNPEAQEIAMRLWLCKETGIAGFASYMKFFRHLLNIQ